MIIDSIILGIVEGITEFLPISSTGHLILTSSLLKLNQTEFLKSFEIAIQLGAIFSIVILYWKTFLRDFETVKRIIVAFIPTAIIGLALYKIFKQYFFSETIVLYSLLIGGLFLIIFELFYKEKETSEKEIKDISYKKSFLIGVFQAVSIIPGVSRAAATIIGGLFLGIKRRAIVEFSFLLAVPTMVAATGYDLIRSSYQFSSSDFLELVIGFVVSLIVALITVKWFLKYIQNNNFIPFGIYRIIVAILFFMLILK